MAVIIYRSNWILSNIKKGIFGKIWKKAAVSNIKALLKYSQGEHEKL
jgi:hypothetical protein